MTDYPAETVPNELTEGYFQWRCRRGMKELDFIMTRYLKDAYPSMTQQDKVQFNEFLQLQDMTLWSWLNGKVIPDDDATAKLVKDICAAGYLKK